MTRISDEFKDAFKKETDRIAALKIEEFIDSDDFHQLVEVEVKKRIDNANTFFIADREGHLSFCFYPDDSDENILINLEKTMDMEDSKHELPIFLNRLEKMVESLKKRIAT